MKGICQDKQIISSEEKEIMLRTEKNLPNGPICIFVRIQEDTALMK